MGSQSFVAAQVPDKKLDSFCPKQKIPLKQNHPAYHQGPVSTPSGDAIQLCCISSNLNAT